MQQAWILRKATTVIQQWHEKFDLTGYEFFFITKLACAYSCVTHIWVFILLHCNQDKQAVIPQANAIIIILF